MEILLKKNLKKDMEVKDLIILVAILGVACLQILVEELYF